MDLQRTDHMVAVVAIAVSCWLCIWFSTLLLDPLLPLFPLRLTLPVLSFQDVTTTIAQKYLPRMQIGGAVAITAQGRNYANPVGASQLCHD